MLGGVRWACRGLGKIRICDGSYLWHIRVLEGPESGELAIQAGLLVKKLSLLGGGPDICIFDLECDFLSER